MTNLQKKSIRNKIIIFTIVSILTQAIILIALLPKTKSILEIEGIIFGAILGLLTLIGIVFSIYMAIMEEIKDFKIRGFLTEEEYRIYDSPYIIFDEEKKQEEDRIKKLIDDTLGEKWKKY